MVLGQLCSHRSQPSGQKSSKQSSVWNKTRVVAKRSYHVWRVIRLSAVIHKRQPSEILGDWLGSSSILQYVFERSVYPIKSSQFRILQWWKFFIVILRRTYGTRVSLVICSTAVISVCCFLQNDIEAEIVSWRLIIFSLTISLSALASFMGFWYSEHWRIRRKKPNNIVDTPIPREPIPITWQ